MVLKGTIAMIDVDQIEKSPGQWLGTTAAAKRLGITTRTLYRFIDEGYIAAYRMGRVIRVLSSDVDAYIEGLPGLSRAPSLTSIPKWYPRIQATAQQALAQ